MGRATAGYLTRRGYFGAEKHHMVQALSDNKRSCAQNVAVEQQQSSISIIFVVGISRSFLVYYFW